LLWGGRGKRGGGKLICALGDYSEGRLCIKFHGKRPVHHEITMDESAFRGKNLSIGRQLTIKIALRLSGRTARWGEGRTLGEENNYGRRKFAEHARERDQLKKKEKKKNP